MWMMSYPGSYLPLFNASARALKDVSPYVAMQLQGFTIFHGYTPAQQPSTVALAAAHRYSYTHSLASTELQVDARCVPREQDAKGRGAVERADAERARPDQGHETPWDPARLHFDTFL